MRRLFVAMSVVVCVVSSAWMGSLAYAQRTVPPAALPDKVAHLLRQSGLPAQAVSVVVQEVDQVQPLIVYNADAGMNPASLMKLLTSMAALEILGPHYTWKTGIYAQRAPEHGILNGDLYFKGGGDPKLTLEQFWLLLRDLRMHGVREIRGDIVLDRSRFEPINENPGRFDNEPLKPQNTVPDALQLNYNSVRFSFMPGAGAERKRVTVMVDPNLYALKIRNHLNLKLGSEPCGDWRNQIAVDYQTKGSLPEITFTGTYPESCGEKKWFFSLHPHTDYFAGVFTQLWKELGGSVSVAKVRMREGTTPPDSILLVEQESPPLSEVLRDMNKFSNNMMARQVFLTIGSEGQEAPANTARATQRVTQWLQGVGINAPELVLENGAGLSRIERISANHLAALLRYAWRSAVMPEFVASLSLFGVDGTTRRRYKNHSMAGQAHLKTGSLSDVRSIAGYVRAASGRRYVLVMMVNDPQAASGIPIQEALLEWLYQQ